MPVYTLYLSTLISSPTSNYVVPIDKTNLANVAWRVDWKSLFGKDIYDYKYCRVRYSLAGETFTASTPPATDWTNYNGYLTVSLPSTFNGVNTNGTILGLIYPQDSPISGTGVHCVLSSTMSESGVDINISGLTDVSQLNIGLMSWSTNQPLTTMQNYQLLLSFDLYN